MDPDFVDGQVIDHSYNPGYIVLSYLVSFVGCWTSLKLLHRRTSHHGFYNWYLLLGAAISMGAVAIWSMHYIGNRAITMLNGERELQIRYSPAYTAGSFFLPICVLSIAFYLLGISGEVHITLTVVVGILTGAAICGMHYLGQGAISNYAVSYYWEYVVGSAFIAAIAATVALGVFFYLKATWTNSWIKRALCASVLAASVSGMHWVATVGTIYRYRSEAQQRGGLTRQATVIIVLWLVSLFAVSPRATLTQIEKAITCCFALVTIAVFAQRLRTRSAHRAQQIALASIIFDTDGKLMVTPDGRLPFRKIMKTYSFSEIFNIDHSVFSWIYRVSHNWLGVANMISDMRAHLRITHCQKRFGSSTDNDFLDQGSLTSQIGDSGFATTFKERFCVAASELANMIHEPLEKLGVLFDAIMFTGTVNRGRQKKFYSQPRSNNNHDSLELGQVRPVYGHGQLLFLVRRANRQDVARLQAAGFSFAHPTSIISSLAESLEVSVPELSDQLLRLWKSVSIESVLDPGVHLACYALRPRYGGWDILVDRNSKSMLPSVQLTKEDLLPWQADLIEQLDDMTVSECLAYLQECCNKTQSRDDDAFLVKVIHAITTLAAQINHPLFTSARLLARPFSVPCRSHRGPQYREEANVIMFRVIADAHYGSPHGRTEFRSLRLFQAQQHVYPGSADHEAFARKIHVEFAEMAEAQARSSASAGIAVYPDEKNIVKGKASPNPHAPFGGILVQKEWSMTKTLAQDCHENGDGVETKSFGNDAGCSTASGDSETFAEELMAFLLEEQTQQSLKARNPKPSAL
ncbi:MAG: hypothetical protein Q9201_005397 [Fulgogasparrea decipioides]